MKEKQVYIGDRFKIISGYKGNELRGAFVKVVKVENEKQFLTTTIRQGVKVERLMYFYNSQIEKDLLPFPYKPEGKEHYEQLKLQRYRICGGR